MYNVYSYRKIKRAIYPPDMNLFRGSDARRTLRPSDATVATRSVGLLIIVRNPRASNDIKCIILYYIVSLCLIVSLAQSLAIVQEAKEAINNSLADRINLTIETR